MGATLVGISSTTNLFMKDIYGFEPNKAACCSMLTTPGFIIGGKMCISLYNKKVMARRSLICLGLVVAGTFITFTTGNQQLIFNEPKIEIVICSTIFIGFGTAYVLSLSFPETVAQVEHIQKNELKIDYNHEEMHAYNAGVYCTIQCISQSVGPIVANSMLNKFGANGACLGIGLILITFAILYMLICGPGQLQVDLQKPLASARSAKDYDEEK